MPSATARKKRALSEREAEEDISPPSVNDGHDLPQGAGASTTNFRNVSACYRCRGRKNRCDQRLPRCTGCEKAKVECIGFDPLTKRAIPRSYISYLESRVHTLEALLRDSGIPVPAPANDFGINEAVKPGISVPFPPQDEDTQLERHQDGRGEDGASLDPVLKVEKLAVGMGTGSLQSSKDVRRSSTSSVMPFSKVVYAAVKSSVSQTPSERAGNDPARQMSSATASGGGTSQSFFSLHAKPSAPAAPFPEKPIGLGLLELYFEYANPQIPILHRPEFMALFDRVYDAEPNKRTPREQYLLNIVFAIGAGIIVHAGGAESVESATDSGSDARTATTGRLAQPTQRQRQPEEYHAAAILHLDSFLGSSPAAKGVGGGLEELQAVLLLAGLALLRPVAPGLWYIIGVAVRLAVDLGLHLEDADANLDTRAAYSASSDASAKSEGRRQWIRDLRRRLWWCVYSFDRLVSTCVSRPCSVPDDVITTRFPSMLDDSQITTAGFVSPPNSVHLPSYKLVAQHYFKLRILQSEILQVLQHRQAERAYEFATSESQRNDSDQKRRQLLPSSYLQRFVSFQDWRADVDSRLLAWKDSAPNEEEIGVSFTPLFLELNYWQAVLLLYRQSLEVPESLAGETSPSTVDVQSPSRLGQEEKQDEQAVAVKVAQAGQRILKMYKQLHSQRLVNYTFLATHHIFMSGISFLSAIWHSDRVRGLLSYEDVEFTMYVATSVLDGLAAKCQPAEACRTALVRATQATISKVTTRSFGNTSTLAKQPLSNSGGYFSGFDGGQQYDSTIPTPQPTRTRLPIPTFDHDLRGLFSEEEIAQRPFPWQPNLQQFGMSGSSTMAFRNPAPVSPSAQSDAHQYASPKQQSNSDASNYQLTSHHDPSPRNIDQVDQSAFTSTIPQIQMDFDWDSLDFLNNLPSETQDHNYWPSANEFDLSFGTGGAVNLDDGHNFDASGAIPDMYGGLYFGNNGNGW